MTSKQVSLIAIIVCLIFGVALQKLFFKDYKISLHIDKMAAVESIETKVFNDCSFSGYALPKDLVIYAATGNMAKKIDYPIDDSNRLPGQFEVHVNSPNHPVGLILVGGNPAIWNVSWTQGTEIKAVYVSGTNRQEVAGVPLKTPIVNGSKNCDRLYHGYNNTQIIKQFSKKLFEKDVSLLRMSKSNKFVLGAPIPPQTKRYLSPDNPANLYFDKSKPRVGKKGLLDLISQGKIRKATSNDVDRWRYEKFKKYVEKLPPIRPRLSQGSFSHNSIGTSYVILDKIIIPSGLLEVTFYLNKGVPLPGGNYEHLIFYDFNSMKCINSRCRIGITGGIPDIPDKNEIWLKGQKVSPNCYFEGITFPENMKIYAGGAYSGLNTRFDVLVDSPKYPVALILGAYELSHWNVRSTSGTEIKAVYLTGYHNQTIKGIPKGVPLVNASYDNGLMCFTFHYISKNNIWHINPLAEFLFGKKVTEVIFPNQRNRGEITFGSRN
ncbi:MAG: hypothetical protein COA45_10260 [Zetaproteobacteria bacterium]|nr:MAG: hypothetical protein COA45_10260 [Zetaproteobacteria bacterium]